MISQARKLVADRYFRELFSGSSTVLLTKLLGVALSYAFILIISRNYGAASTGAFTLATTIAILFSLVGRLGLDMALLRFVAEYLSRNREDLAQQIFKKALRLIIPCTFILSIILFFSSETIAGHLFKKPRLATAFQVISIAVLPMALLLTQSEVLRARKRNFSFSFYQTIAIPLFSILIIAVLRRFTRDAVVPTVSYALAAVVGAALALFLGNNGFSRSAPSPPEQMRSADLLHVSLPMMVSNTLIFIMFWIDTIVIGVFRPEAEVGVYSVALRVVTLSNIILFSIAGVAAPKLVEYHAKNDKRSFERIVGMSARINFWASLPIFGVFAIAPMFLMRLFGGDFEHGALVLLILAAGQFINTVSGPAGLILQMTGNERVFQKIVIGTIALNAALDIILIPSYGISGAALASTVGMFFWNAAAVFSVKSIHGIWTFYIPLLRKYVKWNWAWDLDSALRYEKAVSLVKRLKPQTVVEVGSGNWGISFYAKYPCFAVDVAFDESAKPPLQRRILASGTQLPFSNASTDFVISTDMLEHVPANQRLLVINEMFRIVKPEGLVYIAVPVGEQSSQADRRVNAAFHSRKGKPHPMLRDHIAHGLPSRGELIRQVRAEAKKLGWSVAVEENTPISLWEWNLMWFGVERWVPGLRHFQRMILQPLYPALRRIKSADNYRIVLIAKNDKRLI